MTVVGEQSGAHISESTLLDYLDENTDEEDRRILSAHLDQCQECRAKQRSLANLLGNLGTELLHDAPADVVTRAIRLFPGPEPFLERVRQRLIGLLQFDSALQPAAPGLRSDRGNSRQRVYVAGDYLVDLREELSRDGWNLSGQILGAQPIVGVALLADPIAITGAVESTGEFSFPPVSAGTYTLQIEINSLELVVEALRIGL